MTTLAALTSYEDAHSVVNVMVAELDPMVIGTENEYTPPDKVPLSKETATSYVAPAATTTSAPVESCDPGKVTASAHLFVP